LEVPYSGYDLFPKVIEIKSENMKLPAMKVLISNACTKYTILKLRVEIEMHIEWLI